MTLLYTHPDCLEHVTPTGHPERVDRLRVIEKALAGKTLDRRVAPSAEDPTLLRCHPQAYIDRLTAAVPLDGIVQLDADTHISRGSLRAARRAAGAMTAAIDAVIAGEDSNAFVACRPPGHHAEQEKPMGFCLFGTAAIGAKHALDHHGLTRVAVIDFDVHHGNGTQALLWDEPRTLFCSTHQMPLWPGTGTPEESGACGTILNRPLPPGSDGNLMRRVYEREILPAVAEFAPDLVILSSGFDAHAADPLAQLEWDTEDFTWLTERLCEIAESCCDGRLVSTLEGGYDLTALAASAAAHVDVLQGRSR